MGTKELGTSYLMPSYLIKPKFIMKIRWPVRKGFEKLSKNLRLRRNVLKGCWIAIFVHASFYVALQHGCVFSLPSLPGSSWGVAVKWTLSRCWLHPFSCFSFLPFQLAKNMTSNLNENNASWTAHIYSLLTLEYAGYALRNLSLLRLSLCPCLSLASIYSRK